MLVLRILMLTTLISCGRAVAQQSSSDAPVRCYDYAADTARLENLKAKRLCIGATSDVPARCFQEASDQLRMSDELAVDLCRLATSVEPTRCARQLVDTTSLPHNTIVSYCAAQRWPVVYSPTGGSANCIALARDRTTLADPEAARLCAGSQDNGAVDCFLRGQNETSLTSHDLVDLCAAVSVVAGAPY